MAGFVYRENRVPMYQRMFQEASKKHIRQWNTTPRSKIILYPFYAMFACSLSGSMWMMGRQVAGKKTWW